MHILEVSWLGAESQDFGVKVLHLFRTQAFGGPPRNLSGRTTAPTLHRVRGSSRLVWTSLCCSTPQTSTRFQHALIPRANFGDTSPRLDSVSLAVPLCRSHKTLCDCSSPSSLVDSSKAAPSCARPQAPPPPWLFPRRALQIHSMRRGAHAIRSFPGGLAWSRVVDEANPWPEQIVL